MIGSSDRISAKSFASKVGQNLKKATFEALNHTANSMKKEIGRVGNFKGRSLNQLVRIKTGKDENPTIYVRVGFGDNQTARTKVIILLPEGRRLGLPRVGNQWNAIYSKYKSKFKIVRTKNGWVVLFNANGRIVPVYKIQTVTVKKVPLRQIGDRLASQVSEKISKHREKYD
jgi:hypothetical protein